MGRRRWWGGVGGGIRVVGEVGVGRGDVVIDGEMGW